MRLVALMGLVGIHQAFALRLRSNRQLFLLDGPDDEQSGCRSDCFGHGACDAKKGTCSCETQWHGELCGSTFLHGTSGKRDYSAEVTIVPDGTSFSIDLDGFTTADLFAKLGHLHAVLQQNKVQESAPSGKGTSLQRPTSSSMSVSTPPSDKGYRHKAGSVVGSDFTIPKYMHVHLPAGPLQPELNFATIAGGAVSHVQPSAAVPIIPRQSDSSVFPRTHIAVHVAPSKQYRADAVGILTDTNGLGVAALDAEQDRFLQMPVSSFLPQAHFEGNSELIDLGRSP